MITPTPLVQFRFGCNANGVAQVNDDAWLGSLGSVNAPSCQFSTNGVASSSLLETSSTIADMRDEFQLTNATGLTMEIWMTPTKGADPYEVQPIATFGRSHPSAEEEEKGGCQDSQLYLGQRGNLLEARYTDDDDVESCRILVVRQQSLLPNQLVQVVLVLNPGETSVYMNGAPIISGAPNHYQTFLTSWDPDFKLQLFANHFLSQHFRGSLHQVSLYNQVINTDQIDAMFDRGLVDLSLELEEREPLHLVAYSEPAQLVQGHSSLFELGGFNVSTADWKIVVEVTSLPQFGSLLSEVGLVQAPGFRIPLSESETSVSVFYQAWSDDFFNVPKSSYSGQDLHAPTELFVYRLIAVDAMNETSVLGWSKPIAQEIEVVHVNRPPSLLVPNEAQFPDKQPTGLGARPMAMFEGLKLEDPDRNIDRVRVDVWTYNGTLTLAQDTLELADFETCASRSHWVCHGTGVANRNMTFVAEPDDVTQLLSHLRYNAFHWDQEDSIVIRIYDGAGGPCLKESEHQVRPTGNSDLYYTIHDECYEIVTSIKIPAVASVGSPDITDTKGFFRDLFELDSFGIVDLIFWAVLAIFILCCCFSVRTWIRCVGARGRKVYPETHDPNRIAAGPNNV